MMDYLRCTYKDIEDSFIDEYGVRYSRDNRRLLEATKSISGHYTIKPGTVEICISAFENNTITSIYFPDTIEQIGDAAFRRCEYLTQISFPNSLKEIGRSAFYKCRSLKEVHIPNNTIKAIYANTFSLCESLKNIIIPKSVEGIDESAFFKCVELSQVTLPPTLRIIGKNAFYECQSLKQIRIPDRVSRILEHAFYGCKSLSKIIISDRISEIHDTAFSNALYERVIIIPLGTKDYFSSKFPYLSFNNNYVEDDSLFEKGPFYMRGHEYVDLGLSVMWATCNVGALKPEEFGDYYAWGETEPKKEYSWDNYKFRERGSTGKDIVLSRYIYNKDDYTVTGEKIIPPSGYTYAIDILEPEDDVATVKWGGNWRMPSRDDFHSLILGCSWEWKIINGVRGYLITSMIDRYSDRSIFLPAAGCEYKDRCTNIEVSEGYYWLNSYTRGYVHSPKSANELVFRDGIKDFINYAERYVGRSIRPVCSL